MTTDNVEAAGKPIKTLLVSFEVPADCPDGLGFMVTIVRQAEGKFNLRLTDLDQIARAAPVPMPAPDFSGLIVPQVLITKGEGPLLGLLSKRQTQRAVGLSAPPPPRSYADLVKDLKAAGGEVPSPP